MSGPGELSRTTPRAGAFLVARLRTLDERLAATVPRVLAGDDEEAVHDLRVAIRRIRTVLEVGREVLGRYAADEVRGALRDVMRATGTLRDEEVLREVVASMGVAHPEVDAWLASRRRREERLRRALVARVRRGDVDAGRALLGALLAFRVKPSRDRSLAKYALRAVARAQRGVDRRRSAAHDDVEGLHALRIAWKRLRYTAETFADALPSDLSSLATSAARFQSRLGDLHDLDVAIARVQGTSRLGDEARADLLAALRRKRDAKLAAYVRELGAALTPPPPQAVGTDSLRKISSR